MNYPFSLEMSWFGKIVYVKSFSNSLDFWPQVYFYTSIVNYENRKYNSLEMYKFQDLLSPNCWFLGLQLDIFEGVIFFSTNTYFSFMYSDPWINSHFDIIMLKCLKVWFWAKLKSGNLCQHCQKCPKLWFGQFSEVEIHQTSNLPQKIGQN